MTLFSELKRRRVFRVLIAYLVVGFAVIEGVDVVAPGLQLPDWSVTLVTILVIAGFPITVIVAWAFQVTPDGVKRDPGEYASGANPPSQAGISPTATAVETAAEVNPQGATSPAVTEVTRPTPQDRPSIAVLPFSDMSPDKDQEYFADGIAEELLNALVKIEGLDVAARTSSFSFRGESADVREVGAKLGVSSILEGSVRKHDDRVRITAQLIDVATGFHQFSETYERALEDVFAIQDEISRSIAEALRVRLLDESRPLVQKKTSNAEAYDLYLKGRHLWYRRYEVGLRAALEYFEKSAERDPDFAPAHSGIADVYSILGTYGIASTAESRDKAIEAAERAVSLDPTSAEAHFSSGIVKGIFEWDLEAADRALAHAVELNSEFGKALVWRGVLLACGGDWDRAVTFATQAVTITPDSEYIRTVRAMVLNWTRRFDEALAELDAILERAPHSVLALYSRGLAHVGRGQPGEALDDLELAASLSSRATFVLSFLGTARARAGDREGARQLLEEIEDESRVDTDPPWTAAICYALGDLDRAFELLEEGIDLKLCGMYVYPAWPIWGEDYSDPRWAEFFEAVGVTWPMLPA